MNPEDLERLPNRGRRPRIPGENLDQVRQLCAGVIAELEAAAHLRELNLDLRLRLRHVPVSREINAP